MKEKLETENLFDSLGVQVKQDTVELWQTYPLYGMITKILSDDPGNVRVVLNYSIELLMNIDNEEKIELMKSRCFEPGIFVSTIDEVGENIKASCTTVIFGKKADTSVN